MQHFCGTGEAPISDAKESMQAMDVERMAAFFEIFPACLTDIRAAILVVNFIILSTKED